MANVKITQLPLATTPLTGTEDIPLVQGTTTKQVTVTGLFTSPVMTNPRLGTVGQADLINATGLPISTGVAGLGTGVATFLGTPSSANLRTAVTDETGSGSLVFANAPVLVAPNLGTPTFLVATNATGTAVGLTAGSAITNANLTGAVTSVGNATSLGSFTSAQLRTALTDETGAGSAVFATSPTITAPILNQINDTNNAQILGLSPTTSAVDYFVVKNGIGVGVPLHFYADGASANIGLHIQPKGTGLVTISDGTDFNKGIRFRSSSSAASAITLLDAVSTAGRVVTLPDATTTLVGRDTTDTLTNKTIAFGSNTFSGSLAIANGGTGQATANAALNALLPSQTGNASKYLQTNGADSSWDAISLSTADITGTLGTANGGTGLGGATPFTSGGVVYASSSSALATGSGLTYNGTAFATTGTIASTGSNTSATYFQRSIAPGTEAGTETAIVTTGNDSNQRAGLYSFNNYGSNFTTELIFKANGSSGSATEGLRLTSSSLYTASGINVGIGLSNPVIGLTVEKNNGSGYIAAFRSGTGNPYITLQTTGGITQIQGINSAFTDVNNIAMQISGGNVGIGTSSPSTKLTVYDATSPQVTFNNGTSSFIVGNLGGGNDHILYGTGAYPMVFYTNSTERARIDSSGNLGVGTSSPSERLVVSGGCVQVTGNLQSLNRPSSSVMDFLSGATRFFSIGANSSTYGSFSFRNSTTTANSEVMAIDSAGNLGLGVTPSAWDSSVKALQVGSGAALHDAGSGNTILSSNLYYSSTGNRYIATDFATAYQQNNGLHYWYTAPSGTAGNPISFTQAMSLTAAGTLLVGKTSSDNGTNGAQLSPTTQFFTNTNDYIGLFNRKGTDGVSIYFQKDETNVGNISVTTSATAYNTSSDYRLKNITGPITTSGAYIDSLNPVEGTWKANGSTFVGLIAHEVQEASRTQVATGVKDGEEMQTMDYSNSELIANLIAEVKSLRQRVATLEAQ